MFSRPFPRNLANYAPHRGEFVAARSAAKHAFNRGFMSMPHAVANRHGAPASGPTLDFATAQKFMPRDQGKARKTAPNLGCNRLLFAPHAALKIFAIWRNFEPYRQANS
jgi:hypothetical protein